MTERRFRPRAKTPDTASSRILGQVFDHLSLESKCQYPHLYSMFASTEVEPKRKSFNAGNIRRPVYTHTYDMVGNHQPIITQSCEVGTVHHQPVASKSIDGLASHLRDLYHLTPHKHKEGSVVSSRSSGRSSIDLSLTSYYDCDEPELEQHSGVLQVQDYVTEIVMSPPQYPFKLFISGLKAANDLSTLKEHNITAVLSIGTKNVPGHYNFIKAYSYVSMPNTNHNIAHDLRQALNFLDYELQNHNVLVNDYFGVGRSAAVAAALLMQSLNLSYVSALELVREVRGVVVVNEWLMGGLEAYELERSVSLE